MIPDATIIVFLFLFPMRHEGCCWKKGQDLRGWGQAVAIIILCEYRVRPLNKSSSCHMFIVLFCPCRVFL